MAHRLLRRSLLGSGATAAAVVAGVIGIQVTVALTPDPAMTHTGADLAVVSLTDDASGALFADAELTPGRTVQRCLAVRFTGTGADSEVRLIAEHLSGALLPYLTATVAVGTGGGYAGCRGFAGSTVYHGPLAGLAGGRPGAPGIATGWQPSGSGARTFSVTVRVADDDAAQAKSAGATLRWALVAPEPSAPAEQPPSPSVPPSGPPAAVPTSTPEPLLTTAPSRPATDGPTAAPRTTVPSTGRPSSATPPTSTPRATARIGDAAPVPSRSVAPSASRGGTRSVTRMILSAFNGGLSAIQKTVAGSPGHLAVSVTTLLLLVAVAVACLRWLRRRSARP
jgi:hypothetical protein